MSHDVAAGREWPIGFEAVERARERIRPYLSATPLRRYPVLDALAGGPLEIWVKHNPEKDEGMRGFGAQVVEKGRDYDDAVEVADDLVRRRGLRVVHSTNDPDVMAVAGTITLEILEQNPSVAAPALRATDAGKAVVENAAVEVAGHHAVDETAPEAVTVLEALLPASLEALVEGLEHPVERHLGRPPAGVDERLHGRGESQVACRPGICTASPS